MSRRRSWAVAERGSAAFRSHERRPQPLAARYARILVAHPAVSVSAARQPPLRPARYARSCCPPRRHPVARPRRRFFRHLPVTEKQRHLRFAFEFRFGFRPPILLSLLLPLPVALFRSFPPATSRTNPPLAPALLIREAERMASSPAGSYDCSFKVLLIGDSAVGKSSLLVSFVSASPADDGIAPTIGMHRGSTSADSFHYLVLALWI
jgi:hypothetical protein